MFFEVGRERVGGADVYLNGEKIWSFPDEIVKVEKNDIIFTDIVKGMGSRMPDAAFVKALFFTPLGERSNLSDRVRAIFDRDIPQEILEEQKRNAESLKKSMETNETKKNTTTSVQRVQKGIISGALKILESGKKQNPILGKALYTHENEQIISDGFRAIKFNSPLDLPVHEDSDRDEAENMAEKMGCIIKQASENRGATIMPPTLQELKNFIAIKKVAKRNNGDRTKIIPYELTPVTYIDACLLVEILRVLPGVILVTSINNTYPWHRPVYLKAENGCGVLLPIRYEAGEEDKND